MHLHRQLSRVGSSRVRRLVGVAMLVAAAFGLGSVFTALGSDAPVFQACLIPGGILTQVTTAGKSPDCGPVAQLVTWNSQGQQGPAGPSGPPGADGATHVYVVHTGGTEPQPYGTNLAYDSTPNFQATRRLVASLTEVPAGTYAVTASEFAFSGLEGFVACTLSPGGAQSRQDFNPPLPQYTTVVVTDVVTLQNTSDIGLTCNGPATTSSISAVITAIQVQSATELQMPAISSTASLTATTTSSDSKYCTATITGSGLMPGSDVNRLATSLPNSVLEFLGQANVDGTFSLSRIFPLNTNWSFFGVDPQNNSVTGTYVCQ